jgi:hypothetical protein
MVIAPPGGPATLSAGFSGGPVCDHGRLTVQPLSTAPTNK